jgi:hypothetical protein
LLGFDLVGMRQNACDAALAAGRWRVHLFQQNARHTTVERLWYFCILLVIYCYRSVTICNCFVVDGQGSALL